MEVIDVMRAEFEQEVASTRKALERITTESFAWSPHDKSMSMGQLVSHLVEIPSWVGSILEQDKFEMEADFKPYEAESIEGALEYFDDSAKEALEKMEGRSNENLLETWTFKMGGEVALAMPRVAVLRAFILSHLIHHRGQLTVYLRLNDIPVPAIYGPSADEQP